MYEKLIEIARRFISQPVYEFSALENRVLSRFFTNTTQKVFFLHTLPANVGSALLAMYSRMKNSRGLRGMFVDRFLPEFLMSTLCEEKQEVEKLLDFYRVDSLKRFLTIVPGAPEAFSQFFRALGSDPKYLEKFASGVKVRKFLSRWLDAYGHNSIARAGSVWVCAEQISILAAKSMEWGRPGAGYIELSTRYVDMSGKDCYPIWEELEILGVSPQAVREVIEQSFNAYRYWQGENFDGPLPQFFRERYKSLYTNAEKDLESGVIGETCDVLGNFLPCATLTSVGGHLSGEAFPGFIEHLMLDKTPENMAIVEAVLAEAKKIGADQFARHVQPSEWKTASWEYLSEASLRELLEESRSAFSDLSQIIADQMSPRDFVEKKLLFSFKRKDSFRNCSSFKEILQKLDVLPRSNFDKLWNDFEIDSAPFWGLMSFRGWRDLHRMGFNTHLRTLVSPQLGFYFYNKPAPEGFNDAMKLLHDANVKLYEQLATQNVSPELRQYPMALGNLIGFMSSANLAQWEFCNWQRSKYSVNHEVRQVFLGIEQRLRKAYPWWEKISRANTTPAYVFARGSKAIPLADAR